MTDNLTTELRRLLDERGVRWTSKPTRPETTWTHDGWWYNTKFEPWSDSTFKVTIYDLTPEQAIAATLGTEINGETSDGYHTFNELYHHRAVLFSVIVRDHRDLAWKSRKHHDGTMYDGMFIVGIETPKGQATYHYDIDPYWAMFDCEEREFAPEWDGHTPDDAISRIAELNAERHVETCELPYDELLRCLENDWHIHASWDGLRKFWCIELTDFTTGFENMVRRGVRNVSTNDSQILSNCPFCGGESTVERIGKSGYFYVACNTAYCCDFGKFDTEAEAIAAWNTRAMNNLQHLYETDPAFTDIVDEAAAAAIGSTSASFAGEWLKLECEHVETANPPSERLSAASDAKTGAPAPTVDSRAALEADVRAWLGSWTAFSVPLKTVEDAVLGWLGRQAAITAGANEELTTMQVEAIARLQAENAELRDKLSAAIGHAHATCALVDLEGNVV